MVQTKKSYVVPTVRHFFIFFYTVFSRPFERLSVIGREEESPQMTHV